MKRTGLVAVALWACACSGSGSGSGRADSGTPIAPTLSSVQANVFTPNCTVTPCHNATDLAGNLSLESGVSYGSLVNVPAYEIAPRQFPDGGYVPAGGGAFKENLCDHTTTLTATLPKRVVPGDPTNSFMMWKLNGKDAAGNNIEETTDCGQMPKLSGDILTAAQVSAIQMWIANGAQND